MSRFRLTLLGGFCVTAEDGRHVRIGLRKSRALLAWLAIAPNNRRPRDAAIGLLWADSDDRRAAASLSQAFYALRRDLSGADLDPARADGETVGIDAEAVAVDALEFAALARCRDRESLGRAVALYEGEFLEGFSSPTEEFEEWMQTERRRLRSIAADVLAALLEASDDDEESDQVARTAGRLLEIDPYSEPGQRALMRHHAHRGRIAVANEIYAVFRKRLAEDLGVEPDEETRDLHDAILRGELRPRDHGTRPTADAAPAPVAQRRTRPALLRPALAVGGVAAALTMAAVLSEHLTSSRPDVAPLPSEPSIAVVPFTRLSEDADSALFAQGLTKDLATALARLPSIFVSAGEATAEPGAGSASNRIIAETLGVRHLLRGDVQRSGDRLRVSVRLIDAIGDRYVWSTRYERPVSDFFAIQDDLVLRTIADLRGQLNEGEGLRRTRDTTDLTSWLASTEAYGKFLQFTPAANAAARELWTRALDLDPDRAVPHAGLAFTHYQDAYRGWSADRDKSIALGVEHARTALERDPGLPLGYQALGSLTVLQGDFEKGIRLRRKAVELAPNDFSAVGGLAALLTGTGGADEAVELFRHAVRLNPDPPLWVPIWFGNALHASGHSEEATVWLEGVIARNPKLPHVHARLAVVYKDLGRDEAAAASVRRARDLDPGLTAGSVAKAFSMPGTAFERWIEAQLSHTGIPE